MKRSLLLTLLSPLLASLLGGCSGLQPGADRPPPPPEWEQVDLYGTTEIDREELWRLCGPLLLRCLELSRREPLLDAEEVVRREDERNLLEREITTLLLEEADYALIKVSAITYFREGWPCFLTLDLVESQEADRRMPFRLVQGPVLEDPEGVLAQWQEYETLCWEMLGRGDLQPGRVEGPALHYTFGFEHPDLAPFEQPITEKVRRNKDALRRVLLESGDAIDRASAAFLLAHCEDGPYVVSAMQAAMNDAAFPVRNNSMRVLADIARRFPAIEIPLQPMARAIDWATTTDRNKALATVAPLIRDRESADLVLRESGRTLVRLLQLRQPNNRDYAHQILRRCCQENWGPEEVEKWSTRVEALLAAE